ncbi:MAG: ABC-2 transporter permease [Lachnospiraceae bacterium]
MTGLLYKDFIAVKGKMYTALLGAFFLLIVAARLLFHTEEADILLWGAAFIMIGCSYLLIIFKLEVSVVAVDEGRRQKQYYLSLPVSKKEYVASKYLFLFAAFCAVTALSYAGSAVCLIQCENNAVSSMIRNIWGYLPVVAGSLLFLTALELPFLVGFGARRGGMIKTGILIALFFCGIAYLLFGDLEILNGNFMMHLIRYFEEHKEKMLGIKIAVVIGSLVMYCVSYLISALLFAGKEWSDD